MIKNGPWRNFDSERFEVVERDINRIKPSPENDDIYGAIGDDDKMDELCASIEKMGLEEPIIVTADNYILSGHRRHYACERLGFKTVPVRVKNDIYREGNTEYHRLLAAYNPQRVKSVGSLLREALLSLSDEDPAALLENHRLASVQVDADFTEVEGFKYVRDISEKKRPFLEAAKKVVESMRRFWPLSVRQIHYQLLNAPPLTMVPKRSIYDAEKYRYRNDKKSYNALIELLKMARYAGEISMRAIDDPTRPVFTCSGYRSLTSFINGQISGFLCGYHRDRQLDQPRHIEVIGEKNTLLQIVRPICREYYVPLTLARGYASIPVWRQISERFQWSEKGRMTLIVASDYDPEGFDLADDAIRSLRDLWNIDVDLHRIAVHRTQIDELGLSSDFNPAKESSSRLKAFVERTGSNETWELEALPPEYLQEQLRAAIEANMDMDLYERTVSGELDDAHRLAEIRKEIVSELDF